MGAAHVVHPVQLLVLAKAPVPGRVKTRLTPPHSPHVAARLADAALRDTLQVARETPVEHVVLALDGDVGTLPCKGFTVRMQTHGTLAERIEHAMTQAWADRPLPVLLIGMDTPQVSAAQLARAARGLLRSDTDAVLGPAEDGGFWALGLRRPRAGLVVGVPMSRTDTGARQHERLVTAGLRVRVLHTLRDIDDAADLDAVARLAPDSRLARTLAQVQRVEAAIR